MNFGQYEAFVKAVEAGTMTQAAEELGYSQSGLTRALSSLEEEWGVRLLMRGRNGVQLTPEGERLLPDIRTVLHDQRRLAEHIDEINGLRDGLIRGLLRNFTTNTRESVLNSCTERTHRLSAGFPTGVSMWASLRIRPSRSLRQTSCIGIRL